MKVYVIHRLERRVVNFDFGSHSPLAMPFPTDIPSVVGVYAKRATAEKEAERLEATPAHVICEIVEREVVDE